MFVQVIRGKAKDAAALKSAVDKWQTELRPGAKGFLGGTGGVADDGTAIQVVRFESQEAAEANAARPEQSDWWNNEMSKNYDGDVQFFNCTKTALVQGGGSNDAGFVQVMAYRTKDADAVLRFAKEMDDTAPARPDVIGAMTAVADDGNVFDVIYFTSEEEARKNEGTEMPAEMQEMVKKLEEIVEGDVEFIDLRQPWLD
jgi:hypothetical protein